MKIHTKIAMVFLSLFFCSGHISEALPVASGISGDGENWMALADEYRFAIVPLFIPP